MFHISMGNNALNTDFSVTALKRSNAPSWNEYESGQRWQLPGALGESDRTQRVTNASSVVNDDVQEHLLVVTDQVRSWQTTSDYSPGLIIESDDELDLYRDDRNRSTAPILVYWGDLDRPQTEPLTPQGTSKTLLANNDQRVSWTSSSDLETTTYEIYFDGLLREQTSLQQFVTNEDLTPIDVRVVARDIFGRVSPVSEAAVTF